MATKEQPGSVRGANDDATAETADVEERLWTIVQAAGGSDVGTHGNDLWFTLESSDGLQVRLTSDREARCYDRSANFGISHGGQPASEIFGCYTIADVWTFLRGTFDWSQPKPVMSVLSSREYAEKTDAPTILAILGSIVAKAEP